MRHNAVKLVCLFAVALCAGAALASSPDPESRAGQLAGIAGSSRICEGGTTPGQACSGLTACGTGSTCTGIANVRIAARGLLTVIADTKTTGAGWTATSLPASCTTATSSDPGPCETKNNAAFTLLLEFTLNGKKYSFAETFTRLPDGAANCSGGVGDATDPNCVAQVPDYSGEAGWFQPAVESSIAERSMSGQPVQIRWGGLPPAAETAVGTVLGKTASQRVALSRVDEVPICTDTIPCNLSATNPRFSDHSNGTDVLGTVRRYKVDIAVIGP
jgi:hypothetical protein